jgi:hypothetical protein
MFQESLLTHARVRKTDNMVSSHFRREDDERLMRIMSQRRRRLEVGEWAEIAEEMGKFTAKQLRKRWTNYLKPPLDHTEFTVPERREALKQSIEKLWNWKQVASTLGNGRTRSPLMIRNVVTYLLTKLKKLGIVLVRQEDVDLVPDVLLDWGQPPVEELRVIVEEYRRAKETQEKGNAIFPLTIEDLLNPA